LVFLGSVSDEDLLSVIKTAKEVAPKHDTFFLNLRKVLYGPESRSPRMVWAKGEISEEMGNLQKNLEISLKMPSEKRPYAPHITLGRLKQWEFQKINPEERPAVQEEINLNFEVASIEIMESELKRGGPEYAILESIPLGMQNDNEKDPLI
ncbi:MAG: RNA 2',3'-cyclic phosphodiesterase, partial [Candidatus Nealsonbacteria bacterium]|nr:RNA 2',3'-cyclic phosphodiesterase [Candidatus Nealsonbacteria bacterium]